MIPATVHIAASLRRNHFIHSACSIIALTLAFALALPVLTSAQVYQDDPAHGRSFNRFRAKIILTPPVFTDSAHLPTLPLYYGSTGKRDSTIGSIAYTRTDDQHWRYTATGWQRMTGGLSIVGGDTTILSQTLDSTGQLQGRALFSGAGFKISSSPYYLYSDALRKLVINSTNISYGGLDKRLAVNGAALISDLYLDGQLINTGPPSGSTTYPLGWNPSTQQVEKYTEWPGGISYPLSPGKYLNAYGTFAPLISDSVAEGSTNRYFTNARARAAISLTTTGSSGAATYDNSTGILNIPNYAGGASGVTTLAAIGGTPNANGASISGPTLTLQPANETYGGVLTTGSQQIEGSKYFRAQLFINGGATNYGSLRGGGSYFEVESATGRTLELNRSNTATVNIRGGAASFSASGNTLGATSFMGDLSLSSGINMSGPGATIGYGRYTAGTLVLKTASTTASIHPSLMFELRSTTKASAPRPNMTQTQRLAITSPEIGAEVYQTDGTEGVYIYKSTGWQFAY